MENNATSETNKGRSSGVIADIKDPLVEKTGTKDQKTPSRLFVPQSLRQSFDQVVAGMWPRIQTLAMRVRLHVPRLSRVAVTRTDDQLEVLVDLPGVELERRT